MSIPDSFINNLREQVRLSDLIGRHVVLKPKGREFWGICPFHQEKSGSFSVNNEKQFFHCFGCGAHGDVFRFFMDLHNLSFLEAVERVASALGATVPKSTTNDATAHQQRQAYQVLAAALEWYQQQLRQPAGRRAMAYLEKRGLTAATISAFGLGYAPPTGLGTTLQAQGHTIDQLVLAGLVRDNGSDWFRDRLIFPIFDGQGRAIAFGGRTLQTDGVPKYLNSPETLVFNKGNTLYGFYHARQERKLSQVVIVEGYMDVIQLSQAGIKGALAPLGTALTESQIELAWRLSPEPVICFDGDSAGQRAASRAIERVLPILKPGHSVRFAAMPAGEDPDSLVQTHGSQAFNQYTKAAESLFASFWRHTLAPYRLDVPEQRAAAKKSLLTQVQQIADAGVRSAYVDLIQQEWQKITMVVPKQSPQHGRSQTIGATKLSVPFNVQGRQEQILLATLVNHPELIIDFIEDIGSVTFERPAYEALRQHLIDLSYEKILDKSTLKAHLISEGFNEILMIILNASTYLHAAFAQEGATLEKARQGWLEVWQRYQHEKMLAVDTKVAAGEFAANLEPQQWQRYKELKQAMLNLRKKELV
jgi:DNA primase